MTTSPNPRRALVEMTRAWDSDRRHVSRGDLYADLIDELFFHADERFRDYRPHETEGVFPHRLLQWLSNVADKRQRQAMLRFLRHLVFVDDHQLDALYRDAYRRILTPWILRHGSTSIEDLLSREYELNLRHAVVSSGFLSITLSFNFPRFTQLNGLAGLPDPIVLGHTPQIARTMLGANPQLATVARCVVLEDFVGTGKQAGRILKVVREALPATIPIIFVPLIALQRGVETLAASVGMGVELKPVMVIRTDGCITPERRNGEVDSWRVFRSLIQGTSSRVLRQLNRFDDPPDEPFGYKGSGALLVTSHNTPNNTIPLVHHRAPTWHPLFRRHHHQAGTPKPHYKDGLR